MKRLVEKYAGRPAHELDYTALLRETNVFGEGRSLVPDERSRARLATLLSEAEAAIELEGVMEFFRSGRRMTLEELHVSCELEYWAFFEPNRFSRVLYAGSGAWPTIALYVLERQPQVVIDGVDVIPQTTVLCSRVASELGYRDRLRPSTMNALDLEPERIRSYDAFFLSSAVRPKNDVLRHLLLHKRETARIYAREDEAHPQFYEPVTVDHPHVLSARQARRLWRERHGTPSALPSGCEIGHDGEGAKAER